MYDVVLIGGGIMSVTLGALIAQLQPTWTIRLFERLDDVALESSNPWNNAGTGHAALCELNYTPEQPDGTIAISKAVTINEQFHMSRQFWDYLARQGVIPPVDTFLSPTPHMTFVRGADNVDYLRRRFNALRTHPNFSELEFSDDPQVIASWAPLLIADRDPNEPIAATRAIDGTDVNFGRLTNHLAAYLQDHGADISLQHEVRGLRQHTDGTWTITAKDKHWNAPQRTTKIRSRFVFVGAGGAALHLLQRAGIPEIKGYGGFPISGVFLRTSQPEIVAQHQAKVYGKASVGSPPMSVPHLDTRVVDGTTSLLFGPYAGFSTKFLKKGSFLDLFTSLRPSNILTMLTVAKDNFDLTRYLITEVLRSPISRFRALREFMPTANPADWEYITAGQRVQVMKTRPGERGGVLEFGTELVSAKDGTIAGLLGASPGASTAVSTMLDLLRSSFPDEYLTWQHQLATMMPSLSVDDADTELASLSDRIPHTPEVF
ncbi:malate dehydrogenase (quinone) [Jonesia denitrificans]|uniref:Probable malate:quinone oxidoreductase n=2 Tax=Jonesia TaxID=43673 RepID=C7R5E7_JONDD|nr:malate dehydrogenase (quinone) [Jonesia denitrificans]ACV09220.1 malate/quinone oxidoreductase [Jonesia denitrificans DSM 20603]ASE09508.1 malate dehydrogenase (quinone) [Jonesia denitrificans]QXB44505.1 malate dehydrogenase (quinone) [Jonesia denitrificans]SQH21454.1 Probable malate:quinone oxidoreductase [Jonesia denitrificans]